MSGTVRCSIRGTEVAWVVKNNLKFADLENRVLMRDTE
jgi:hypothetical protein